MLELAGAWSGPRSRCVAGEERTRGGRGGRASPRTSRVERSAEGPVRPWVRFGRVTTKGGTWSAVKLHGVASAWTPAQRAELLVCMPVNRDTWAVAETLGPETDSPYWRVIGPYGIDPADVGSPPGSCWTTAALTRRSGSWPSTDRGRSLHPLIAEAIESGMQRLAERGPAVRLSLTTSPNSSTYSRRRARSTRAGSRPSSGLTCPSSTGSSVGRSTWRANSTEPRIVLGSRRARLPGGGRRASGTLRGGVRGRAGGTNCYGMAYRAGLGADGTIDAQALREWVRRARERTGSRARPDRGGTDRPGDERLSGR